MPANFTLSDDADLLTREPNLDQIWPRKDQKGNAKNDWRVQHLEAARRIERELRVRKTTPEPFELGRLSQRSKENLRESAKLFALYFIFSASDTQGDDTGFFSRKQRQYLGEAEAALDAESNALDYDNDGNGIVDEGEKQRPNPTRFIRG